MLNNIIQIELMSEVHQVCTYKVIYQESEVFTVTNVRGTFNYKQEEIDKIPEFVLDFVESYLKD